VIRWVWLASFTAFLAALAAGSVRGATPVGTQLSNTVVATYQLSDGTPITTVSNTVTATVAAVPSLSLGPNENGCNPATDNVGAGLSVVKTFTITNTGNVADTYTLAASVAGGGSIASLALLSGGTSTPIANGGATPLLATGASVQVAVTLATTGVAVGADLVVTLKATSATAQSTTGTPVANSASQCAIVAARAAIGGPGGPNTPVTKLVDGVNFEQVQPGQRIKYTIGFENTGGVPALNVVLTDVLPAHIIADIATVALNGNVLPAGAANLAGQTLTVKLGTLAPGSAQSISFFATVESGTTLGSTFVNVASIASDNASSSTSTQASVLVGLANIVYDGYVGASAPVSGASVALLDPKTNLPIALAATPNAGPNGGNVNPFTTGGGGAYGFVFSPAQLGSGTAANGATYVVAINAPGYRSRRIQIVLTPNSDGTLYNVTLTALDGQPLANAGAFSLAQGPISLQNVFGLFGNLPLFKTQAVSIVKTVDRDIASSGDRLVYTLSYSNSGDALGATTVVDQLPAGVVYAPGTGRLDGKPLEPVVSGRTLTWSFTSLTTAHTIVFASVILPGILDQTTLNNIATISAVAPNAPGFPLTASSSAQTFVVPGVFSNRTVITGRVFLDLAQTGYFVKPDVGLPGVRIYLEDGESVVTDQEGRFDFPGVKEGMHVLRLDPTTLPDHTRVYADRNYDSERSPRRLIHGVFDGGIIQDINFAIEALP
jgi:uncharacterized repeat protein (TIGR01451 family)